MKKIHIMLCLALGILVSGCFTSYVSTKQMMGIYQGMTQSQVESVLGKPDFRRFDGDMEEWEFHRDNGTPVLTSVTIIVQFVNREVVSMDTFKGYGRPAPMHSVVVPPAVNTTVEVFPNHEQVEEARLMTDPEFDEFINKLKITVMNEDQKKLVDRMLRTYDVTSNQCVKIVKEISYTPDQVEMMKKLYPYVRDKRNFNKVIDILFSNAYKDEMRKFIEEYHQNNKNIKYHVACKANGDGCMDESKLDGVRKISDTEFEFHNARCFKIHVPQVGAAQAIYYDVAALNECCKYIEKNGIKNPIVYIMACRIGPFAKHFYKKIHKLGGRVYLNPDGHEWMRAKWSAPIRKYWKISEQMMIKWSDLDICDSVNI